MGNPSKSDWLTEKNVNIVVRNVLKTSDFVVKEFFVSAANSQVSGFLGDHGRLFVTVFHKGETVKLQFFAKTLPEQDGQKKLATELEAFPTEVSCYTEILPTLSSFGVTLPYPECYHALCDETSNFLVLEDLSKTGYRLCDSKQPLDFQHCALVLQEVAKLHASSAVLEKRKGVPLNKLYPTLKETLFSENGSPMYRETFLNSMTTIGELMKLLPKHKDSSSKYNAKRCSLLELGGNLVRPWDVLNVICHGDLWINNILFRYGDSGTPVSAKLLDLQTARYGPPTLDIIFFIFVSTTRGFRERYAEDLLKLYHESFSKTVHQLGTVFPQFTYEVLLDKFKSMKLLGAINEAFTVPFLLLDNSTHENITDSTKDEFEYFCKHGHTEVVLREFESNAAYRERLTEIIEEFLQEINV